LPNVFTPDGDLTFDLYNPVTSRNVEEVDFVVYNRWGTEVFRTRNPQIEWDGTHQQTGAPVSEGVYYYVCKVAERRLSGISYRELNGFFHLYRGQ
jgi:gliding motility-associated-like protein